MECCLSAATAIDYTPYIINETRMSTLQSEYINVKTIFKKNLGSTSLSPPSHCISSCCSCLMQTESNSEGPAHENK